MDHRPHNRAAEKTRYQQDKAHHKRRYGSADQTSNTWECLYGLIYNFSPFPSTSRARINGIGSASSHSADH
jgi:hypothetical protein